MGGPGSGKTTVAVALAAMYSRPGVECALRTEQGAIYRYDAAVGDFDGLQDGLDLLASADFMFIEVRPDLFERSMARPRDLVVRLERMPAHG